MARNEAPPFARGGVGTAYSDFDTIDTSGNPGLLAKEWIFEDLDWSGSSIVGARSNANVVCIAVRNVSGAALLPARAWKLNQNATVAGQMLQEVEGYAAVGDAAVIGDEFLPAVGVANGSIAWGVKAGPSKWTCGANATYTLNQILIPSTNGTFIAQDVTGATTALSTQIQGALARSITPTAALVSGTDYLVNVKPNF